MMDNQAITDKDIINQNLALEIRVTRLEEGQINQIDLTNKILKVLVGIAVPFFGFLIVFSVKTFIWGI
jgi:hypothetical protein